MLLNLPPDWRAEFEGAGLHSDDNRPGGEDPVLKAATRRTNLAVLLHWAAANIQRPGERVPYYVTPDMEGVALALIRRGQQGALMNWARTFQSASWHLSLRVSFHFTQDPALLREVLEIANRSISDFVEGNFRILAALADSERAKRQSDSHVDKRELVSRIIDNRTVGSAEASALLGYDLEQLHYGALIWSEAEDPTLAMLEEAARALARCASAAKPMIVLVGSATLWVWCSAKESIDRRQLALAMKKLPEARIAIGSACRGMDGFRRSHLEALSVQRVLGRLRAPAQVVSIDQVRLVSLLIQDPTAAQRFVRQTLGGLSQAEPTLQRALRVFLARGCNASEAAQALHTHRNTLLRRIARAEALLPHPLADSRLNVAAALELLEWTSGLPDEREQPA